MSLDLDVTTIIDEMNPNNFVIPGYVDPGGKVAWGNAVDVAGGLFAEDYDRDEFVRHFTNMGFSWDRSGNDNATADDYTDAELKALMLQEVCHAITESTFNGVFDEEHANYQGFLCLGDDGRWYFYVGE